MNMNNNMMQQQYGGIPQQQQQQMMMQQQQMQQQMSMGGGGGTIIMDGLAPLQATAAQDKISRELFVGNTPPGTTELLLQHFVNAAMRRVGLCQPHESPVHNARVNTKFAFVELIDAEAANKCLNLNGIPFLTAYLKISRPSKYVGPNIPTKTWQELTGQDTSIIPDPEMEKLQRELFIGNTTPEMTPTMLTEFLGNAMQQVGLTIEPGNPIVTCRVSGKFAFIELRTPDEAKNALNLNNIPCMGTALRVGRPSKYNGPPDQHGNWEDILAKYLSGEITTTANNTNNNTNSNTENVTPTKVVMLQNMLTIDDLNDEEEYNDILDDTKEQCNEFGKLNNIIIPKANMPGATKIFLEYETTTDAAAAIHGLQGKTFDGRLVEATYYDETKFYNQQYE